MTQSADALQNFIRDLRQAREYQHVSLDRVAEETRISLDFLQALEGGEWERIPAAFLRGYLTAYAEAIGMVRDKVLKRFDELGYQAPPPRVRDPQLDIPSSLMAAPPPRNPVTEARAVSSEAAHPALPQDPEAGRSRVPSLWDVIPVHVKVGAGLAVAILAFLLIFGTGILIGGLSGDHDADPEDLPLPAVTGEGQAALQGFPPFKIRLRQARAGQVQVFSSEQVHFSGLLPADSTLNLISSTDLTIQVEHLEHLSLWRDERPLDLPDEGGAAELVLSGGAENIIRRIP